MRREEVRRVDVSDVIQKPYHGNAATRVGGWFMLAMALGFFVFMGALGWFRHIEEMRRIELGCQEGTP